MVKIGETYIPRMIPGTKPPKGGNKKKKDATQRTQLRAACSGLIRTRLGTEVLRVDSEHVKVGSTGRPLWPGCASIGLQGAPMGPAK